MIQLNSGQVVALSTVLGLVEKGQPIISLTGSAGTGKTTILKNLMDKLGERAVAVTPTNKAATQLQSKGVDAATYFKRFFVVDDSDPRNLRFVAACDWDGELPEGKIPFSPIIVLDEGSMLGSWGLKKLRQMCDTLVLVGDGNQLPPVGDRDNPRGFFCTRNHDAVLNQVMRNEGDILKLATAIRQSEDGFRLKGANVDDFWPEEDFETVYILDRPQLISYRNITRQMLNQRCRRVLGFGGVLPMPGELMVCRSNYSDTLLNGTQVIVRSFKWQEKTATADIQVEHLDGRVELATVDMVAFFKDLPTVLGERYLDSLRGIPRGDEEHLRITFGYCITAHTAQGGEWPSVCVVDERRTVKLVAAREQEEDPRAMDPGEAVRRWFYTAVTRAQQQLYIVNEQWTKG